MWRRKLIRRLVTALALAVNLGLGASIPAGATEGITLGPFKGASPDSGTCGNDWANDTFSRVFHVTVGSTVTVREDFIRGRFTTLAGRSPGACNTSTDTGGTVVAGVKGHFGGSETGPVTGGTFNPKAVPNCPPPNKTSCFIKAFFGPNAVFNPSTFKFLYRADCHQALVERFWQNADPASGGNRGDIKSAPGIVTTCEQDRAAATESAELRRLHRRLTGGACQTVTPI